MSEEIAGLYVSIGADLSGLLGGLEETQALLEGMDLGIASQLPLQIQQMMSGVQGALAPLPAILAASLQSPLENALGTVAATLEQRGEAIIQSLYAMAARIQGIAAQLGLPSPIHIGALEGRATGGPVMGGQAYLVGEAGPELFVPGTSGTVIPNHALGGGGLSIQGGTFHIYGVQDVESLLDQLQDVARQRG